MAHSVCMTHINNNIAQCTDSPYKQKYVGQIDYRIACRGELAILLYPATPYKENDDTTPPYTKIYFININ